jgi:hypothetical protein
MYDSSSEDLVFCLVVDKCYHSIHDIGYEYVDIATLKLIAFPISVYQTSNVYEDLKVVRLTSDILAAEYTELSIYRSSILSRKKNNVFTYKNFTECRRELSLLELILHIVERAIHYRNLLSVHDELEDLLLIGELVV